MALNPFDPQTQRTAAVAWAEQLDAGVKEVGRDMLEAALHRREMCSETLPENIVAWFDMALEFGAVAMGLELVRLGRVKED